MRFAVIAAALVLSTPAFADPQAYYYTANGELSNNSGDDSIDLLQDPQPQLDNCVRLMKRAFYLADPASFDRAIDARHEMEMARTAFHQGDAFACKRHAMHALEDRS